MHDLQGLFLIHKFVAEMHARLKLIISIFTAYIGEMEQDCLTGEHKTWMI